jgi:hypothetical protein
LLNVAAGDYGSLPNLALFIAALFVTLCVLPAGAPFALFLALRDLAALGHAPTEDIPDWLIRDALMWSGIVILAYFFEKAVIRVRAIILRSLVVSAITFFAVAISLGAPQWFAGGHSPTLLAFGIGVATVLFLLLWTCRTMLLLVLCGSRYPEFLVPSLLWGLTGSATLACAAAWIAWVRGADILRLDDVHVFYVLIVPAIAGFGLFSPKAPAYSRMAKGLWLTAVAGLLLYSWPLPFLAHARMECDWDYEEPHHALFGFEGAPWHWEGGYSLTNWAGAPAALVELTLSYITQPLVGLSCAD